MMREGLQRCRPFCLKARKVHSEVLFMKHTISEKKQTVIIFISAVLFYAVMTCFHEPWFDEAQVWQIAKCASLKDILFTLPHYEGHPALWTLILMLPAKAGVPYEVSLKLIGGLLYSASAALILFRSPFPKAVKYALPFSYFIFYQYGIIVRPYALMLLSLLFLAAAFPKRKERPLLFVLLLMLLSFTSAYGLVLAGGIALCLVAEILEDHGISYAIKHAFTDKRSISLFLLLGAAILEILQILPAEDIYVASAYRTNPFILTLVCSFFSLMSDCILTQSSWFLLDRSVLQNADIAWYSLLICILIGSILWFVLYLLSAEGKFRYFVVPYSLFAIFAAAVHFSGHHLGIAMLFFIFWLWITLEDEKRFSGWRKLKQSDRFSEKDIKLLSFGGRIFLAFCIIVSLYWTVSSCVLDIMNEYSYGRKLAAFIKEHDLEQEIIYSSWEQGGPACDENGMYVNTSIMGAPALLNAYFDRNIVANFNAGNPEIGYMYWRIPGQEEDRETIEKWSSGEIPGVLLGDLDIQSLFSEVSMSDYTIVYAMNINYIWKGDMESFKIPVYARNDLLDQYGLEETELTEYGDIPATYRIPEEQLQRFKNGEIGFEELLPFEMNDPYGP